MKYDWDIVICADECPNAIVSSLGYRLCMITYEQCTREGCPRANNYQFGRYW